MTPEILLIGIGLAILLPVVPFALELLALRRLTTAAFGTLMAWSPAFAMIVGLVVLHQVPGAGRRRRHLLRGGRRASAAARTRCPPAAGARRGRFLTRLGMARGSSVADRRIVNKCSSAHRCTGRRRSVRGMINIRYVGALGQDDPRLRSATGAPTRSSSTSCRPTRLVAQLPRRRRSDHLLKLDGGPHGHAVANRDAGRVSVTVTL